MGVGSVYTARAPGTNLVTNLGSTAVTLTWDTEVDTSPDITRQSGNTAFRIQNTGRYLVISSVGMDYSDIGNNNRHVVRARILLGGSGQAGYDTAGSFGRGVGADDGHACAVIIIDHTVVGGAGDDITADILNVGDVATSTADQFANQSGIQIIRLPDPADAAILNVRRTTAQTITAGGGITTAVDPSGWDSISWDTQDAETDSGVIEWVSGTDITLKESGWYLVNFGWLGTSGTGRKGQIGRLTLDGTEIRASRAHGYLRNLDGADEQYPRVVVLFEAVANDVLLAQVANSGESTGNSDVGLGNIQVLRMPNTAKYLRIYEDAARSSETSGAIDFTAEETDDLGVHDNVTNPSRISGDSDDHDWLLLGQWQEHTESATENSRVIAHLEWSKTGTTIQYGSSSSYNRGNTTDGVFLSGGNAALAIKALGSSDYVDLRVTQRANTGDQQRQFVSERFGISGVALDTLAVAAIRHRRLLLGVGI